MRTLTPIQKQILSLPFSSALMELSNRLMQPLGGSRLGTYRLTSFSSPVKLRQPLGMKFLPRNLH